MKLANFELADPAVAIELVGLRHRWDLHSWANFTGFRFSPDTDELLMEWDVPRDAENPWGSPGNTARGCRLRFTGISFLRMTPRDEAYPRSEALCLGGVSKVIPDEPDYRFKKRWEPGKVFRLLFRELEIGAATVQLEAIDG
jgi:hypothetical protein